MEEHKSGHAKLAAVLEEREVIFAKDVEEIFGKRPWASRADEILQEEQEQLAKKSEKDEDNIPKAEKLAGENNKEVK